MTDSRFTWVPFMEELADKLLAYRANRGPLVRLLEEIEQSGVPMGLLGAWRQDIDPFTFLAALHRNLVPANRAAIALKFKTFFGIASGVPSDYDGVPTFSSQRARLVGDKPTECDLLWRAFELALADNPLQSNDFLTAVDAALQLHGVAFNLFIGLFWVRPQVFVPGDAHTRGELTKVYRWSNPRTAAKYCDYVSAARRSHPDIVRFSAEIWQTRAATDANNPADDVPADEALLSKAPDAPRYWFVGAMWNGQDDKTAEFIRESVWKNHWSAGIDPKHYEYAHILDMRPGERIAIKSSYVRKHNLPFAANGKSVSVMRIKATGTIEQNPGDGVGVRVVWDRPPAEPREWYFFTSRTTIWRLGPDLDEKASGLVRFTFHGAEQDLKWYLEHPYWGQNFGPLQPMGSQTAATALNEPSADGEGNRETAAPECEPYTVEHARSEGVFLQAERLESMVQMLRERKNIILQGPPGVGKTFIADKLAYLLIGAQRKDQILRVQFHQSMSYEDFVQGLQPKNPGWHLTAGKFIEAAERAALEPATPFVVIIDEINRGNPSAIFGELLTLLEADKRNARFGIQLRGSPAQDAYHLPPNLHVIGTMNRADRSLAPLDSALRRRFAFFEVEPNFGDDLKDFVSRSLGDAARDLTALLAKVSEVNDIIKEDPHLGSDALIGHSYFCRPPQDTDPAGLAKWFRSICEHDLIPLLQEHWFSPSDKEKLDRASKILRRPNV